MQVKRNYAGINLKKMAHYKKIRTLRRYYLVCYIEYVKKIIICQITYPRRYQDNMRFSPGVIIKKRGTASENLLTADRCHTSSCI